MWLIFDRVFEALFSGALRIFSLWRRSRLINQAQTWLRITGRGFSSQAKSNGSFSYPVWSANIGYTYVVSGEYYSEFVSFPGEDETHAEGLALGWTDREVVVRYNPRKPNVSTLLLGDQG